ncbi:hypothetical protein ACKWRH_24895 [Bradyrhizobium sp. Pa8]|uniref:hypothetical protein n=1 Tax=Bradyrhizobium sp. Pa8 TaxID=3386552 RepID=UPI00403FA016
MKRPKPGDTSAAAYDLGLTEEARQDYRQRLSLMFAEACAIFGPDTAASLFRDEIKAGPKRVKRQRPPPPRKSKGPHDPESDRDLVMLWKAGSWESKRAFAEAALKNQSVKHRGRSRAQDKNLRDSLVRRLNRALQRKSETNR